MSNQVREGAWLIALAALIFLTRLGSMHFWDDDEAFFAETAREMYLAGDLVVPRFNGSLFAHKPPFMYWMMIGAYYVFGVNEFAARLPSVLFGIGTVLLVWRMGRILYAPRVGIWAGTILATSLNFVVISRAACSDAELAFFCTLAIYFFIRGAAARGAAESNELTWSSDRMPVQPSRKTWLLVYAAMGLAVLVKGPIGVILPTGVIGLFLLCQRAIVHRESAVKNGDSAPATDSSAQGFAARLTRAASSTWTILRETFSPGAVASTIRSLQPLTALTAVALVAGPWYLDVSVRTGGEFLEGFFGVHHFRRFLQPMDNHGQNAAYYFAVICIGFFPWIIFLSPSAVQWWSRVRSRHSWRAADVLCACWCFVWFGFFSLATTKFPHYVVPMYPAMALLTAAFVDRWIATSSIYRTAHRRTAWITVGVVGVVLIAALPFVCRLFLQEVTSVWFLGVPLVVTAALAWWHTERQQVFRGLASLVGGTVVFLLWLFAVAALEIDAHQTSPRLGAAVREHAAGTSPKFATYRYSRPSLIYYCSEMPLIYDQEDAVRFFDEHPHDGYMVMNSENYEKLLPHVPRDVHLVAQLPWFLKIGRSVVVATRRQTDEATATRTIPGTSPTR